LINFWGQIPSNSNIGNSQSLSQFGDQLARENFSHIVEAMKAKQMYYDIKTKQMANSDNPSKLVPHSATDNERELVNLLVHIRKLEAGHEEKLTQAAKDAVSQIFGDLPQDIFQSSLTGKVGKMEEEDSEEPEEMDDTFEMPEMPEMEEGEQMGPSLDPETIKKEAGKRILMNSIVHGSSLSVMDQVPHLVGELISQIDPGLIAMYERFSQLTSLSFFLVGDELMAQQKQMMQMMQGLSPEQKTQLIQGLEQQLGAEGLSDMIDDISDLSDLGAGWSKVEKDDEGNFSVKAQGVNFPVLAQEIFKGAMELLSLNSFEGYSPEDTRAIYEQADRLEDEKFLEMVGPSLWRKFRDAFPQNQEGEWEIPLSRMMQQFSKENPDEIYALITDVVQNPENATARFSGYAAPPEEEEAYQDSYSDDDDDDDDFGVAEPEGIDMPDEEMGDVPDDADDIMNQLFGKPKSDKPESQFGQINQGLPPVEFDDDDDDDKPFWLDI